MKHLIIVIASAFLFVSVEAQDSPKDPWGGLSQKKGWILLGIVKSTPNVWRLGLSQKISLGSQFEFEVVGKPERELPKNGDVIRLDTIFRIVIIDFLVKGETMMSLSPVVAGQIEAVDETGIYLPVGLEVKVERVTFGEKGPGSLKAVWALVSDKER